jgi:hypothetical protein
MGWDLASMPLKAAALLLFCPAASLLASPLQLKPRDPLPANGSSEYRVKQGQRIAVKFINTLTTRNGAETSPLYLQTIFPVTVSDRVVIPAGSYIDAEVTEVRKEKGGKGRAELFVKLGRLTLPNGVQRPLRATLENATGEKSKGPTRPLRAPAPMGMIAASFAIHGSDAIFAPDTVAEIVLQDPIVFPADDRQNQ